jgi:DNA-binding protein HU-beta
VVKESLVRGMSVQIRGFGSFFRKKRASKKARNISKGTTIDIPAREVPAFKPSREFLDSLG